MPTGNYLPSEHLSQLDAEGFQFECFNSVIKCIYALHLFTVSFQCLMIFQFACKVTPLRVLTRSILEWFFRDNLSSPPFALVTFGM